MVLCVCCFREAVLTVTQVATEAEAGRGDSMSKEEEVIGK